MKKLRLFMIAASVLMGARRLYKLWRKPIPRRGGRSVPGVVSRKRSACMEFAIDAD